MVWTLLLFSLFFLDTGGTTTRSSVGGRRFADDCIKDMYTRISQNCFKHVISLAEMNTIYYKNITEPADIYKFIKEMHLVRRVCENYVKVLQCQEKHINTCPAGKRLLEFGGFSVKYSKRATANLCKNQKDILDGLKCIYRDLKFLQEVNGCYGEYLKYINDNMKKSWDGLGKKEMLLKSCQYLGEAIICTSRSTKCKNFSKLLKDFMFATMTERCYETTSYNSPFRVNSASVAKPLACILFLLMLLVCIGLV